MRSRGLILIVIGTVLALGLSLGASAADFTNDEATIKKIEHEIADATTIDQFMRHIDKDAVLYDFVPPLSYKGATAIRQHEEALFFGKAKDIKAEFLELVVTTDGKLALARSIQHFAWTEDGKPREGTWRLSDIYRKSGAEWRLIHAHVSVPIEPKTLQAQMNLKP
jgi:ketosteroid isomerase-like protein